MKKVVFFPTFLFLSFLLFSCSSVPLSIEENSPVVVFSVYGNSNVPWLRSNSSGEDEDDGTGILSTTINKAIDGNNPELLTATDRLDYAEESFHVLFDEIAGVKVVDRDDFLASEIYEGIKPGYLTALDSNVFASDFKKVSIVGRKTARMIMDELDAKSLIIAEFLFQKRPVGAGKNNQIEALVTMKVHFYDVTGKQVFTKSYTVPSAEKIPATGRKYDKGALVDLFPDTIDAAISQFVVDLMN